MLQFDSCKLVGYHGLPSLTPRASSGRRQQDHNAFRLSSRGNCQFHGFSQRSASEHFDGDTFANSFEPLRQGEVSSYSLLANPVAFVHRHPRIFHVSADNDKFHGSIASAAGEKGLKLKKLSSRGIYAAQVDGIED
jgi:hypothetical protein